jgi:hypothetical protein
MRVGPDGDVDPGQSRDLRSPGPGGVDDDRRAVSALVGPNAPDPGAFDIVSCDLFIEKEIGAEPFRPAVESVDGEQGRGVAVVGGIRPSDEASGIEVGDDAQEGLGVQPVDVQAVFFLDDEEFLEGPLLFAAVGDERVAALAPFDLVPEALLPGREDLEAAQADADLGRVGMGGPEAADGPLVRALSDARILVDDQDAEPGFGQRERGGPRR